MKQRPCHVVAVGGSETERPCLVSFICRRSRAKAAKLREEISKQGFQVRECPLSGMGWPWVRMLETNMPMGELVPFLLDHFENVVRLERDGDILKGKDADGHPIAMPIHPGTSAS